MMINCCFVMLAVANVVVGASFLNSFFKEASSKPKQSPRTSSVLVYDIPDELLHSGGIKSEETCPYDFYNIELYLPEIFRHRLNHTINNAALSLMDYEAVQADYYLVPQYSTCHFHQCLAKNTMSKRECEAEAGKYLKDILDYIDQKYPFWDRKQGMDHIFIFPHDHGADLFHNTVWTRVASSIHLTQTGRYTEDRSFNPSKDIGIPVLRDYSHISKRSQERYLSTEIRPILAYFRGTYRNIWSYSRGIRQIMAKLAEAYPREFFIKWEHVNEFFYWSEISMARFVLCPPGWAPWSARLFDAVMVGAIPVIIADEWSPPFEGTILDYSSFTIRVPEKEAMNLRDILLNVGEEEERRLRANMVRVYQHFVYAMNPFKDMDAFESLYSILSERAQKRKVSEELELVNDTDDPVSDGEVLLDFSLLDNLASLSVAKVEL